MLPIRLVIPGDYWDSQIYRGRLYLTTMNGGTDVYDWDRAVESLIRQKSDRLALTCAFLRGDYLYHPEWSLVFDDPDIGTLLMEKFSFLAKAYLEMPPIVLEHSLLGSADAPGGLSDDTAVYGNYLYAATESGLLRANIRRNRSKRNRSGIGSSETIWDGASLSLAIRRGGDLAIAAGEEGLLELKDLLSESLEEPYKVSNRHTIFADYAFASIYGFSDLEGGYLEAYNWIRRGSDLTRQYIRTFEDGDIFDFSSGMRGMSWANQEKIYLCTRDKLFAVRYVQKEVGFGMPGVEPFRTIGSLDIPTLGRKILGGGIPFFGVVIEHEDGLIIVQSDNGIVEIPGPVTKWRVFPRSSRYENHLHIVFEDRVEIWSFNHDYMVSQRSKLAGIEYRQGARTTKPHIQPAFGEFLAM
jgi:hypothetical protein